jgi:hypothetical protein
MLVILMRVAALHKQRTCHIYGIQLWAAAASRSTKQVLVRLHLRKIVDASWFNSNTVTGRDLQIQLVRKYAVRGLSAVRASVHTPTAQ